MFVVLLLFWLLLNGHVTFEILATGIILCLLVWVFIHRYFGYTLKKEIQFVKRLPKASAYFVWLVGEIFRSAMKVIALIWSPKKVCVPHLSAFEADLKTNTGHVMLANSITMTPGTVTVTIDQDRYLVHCLDETFADGLENSEMERRIRSTEA